MKRLMEVVLVLPIILAVTLLVATMAYTGSDSGRMVTVKAGDQFQVKLDENPTTGYSWNMTADSGLRIAGDQYLASSTGLMGSGGYHTWTITALKAGTYQIRGVYKRPWESASGQDRTFTLTVKVVDRSSGTAALKNMTVPTIKSLTGLKPDFARNLTSFGNVLSRLRFMAGR